MKVNGIKNITEEEWKDVEGYEGYYQISNKGRIKSLERSVVNSINPLRYRLVKERLLIQSIVSDYYSIVLNKEGKKENFMVHRMVAIAFLPNPYNKPEVNHKNANKLDNNIDNLEWATKKENMEHASKNELMGIWRNGVEYKRKAKPVTQYAKDGKLIKIWDSSLEAAKQTKFNRECIHHAAKKGKIVYGYRWSY